MSGPAQSTGFVLVVGSVSLSARPPFPSPRLPSPGRKGTTSPENPKTAGDPPFARIPDRNPHEMPPVTPGQATLILDHVLGDPSLPAAVAKALLAALPHPSDPTPRLCRAVVLRALAADPVSETSLQNLHFLASLTASPSAAASRIATAHIAVAAFLAASAPDFDAAAMKLFERPSGRVRRAVDEGGPLASDVAMATVDQFEAAVGNSSSQTILRGLWGNRAAAEDRVRDLVAAEWAAIGPSKLVTAAERIVGDGALETWRAADEVTRAKLRILGKDDCGFMSTICW